MEKSNSIINDLYEDKIIIIMNQTIYNYQEAADNLAKHNFNHIAVIREYIGISDKTQSECNINVNQEIYKQIRKQIDISVYNNKNPLNIDHIKQNLLEEQKKQNS